MSLVVKGGTIITAADKFVADILVEGGKVEAIATRIDVSDAQVIDASNRYVIPGGVDVHTHIDLPSMGTTSSDDFETASIAAAFGGTTTILDFAIQSPSLPLMHAVEGAVGRARDKSVIDYGFHLMLSMVDSKTLEEMHQVVDAGVSSFKVFMAYPGTFMLGDADILRLLYHSRDTGALVLVHAENGGVIQTLVENALGAGHTEAKWHALTRPPLTESEATARACTLAEISGSRIYVVHLSAAQALAHVREARRRGVQVLAESCPHHLVLSDGLYESVPGFEAAKYVMSPPLRSESDLEELWRGLANHDLQVVSSDHCPFCMTSGYKGFPEQKQLGSGDFSRIPNGVPGIEDRLVLMFTHGVGEGRIGLNRWVDLVATSPAKLFGLYPEKGTIAVGSDADLVVWDPVIKGRLSASTHHMRVDYNAYEGMPTIGAADVVVSRGEVIVQDGLLHAKPGRGNYLRRRTTPALP